MLNRFSRRLFCTAVPQPWLFVGLGNPGDKYKGTRHNVGFEMIDAFAESQGIPMDAVHCKAIFGQGFVGDVPVFLAKPQTYMNLSGESLMHIWSAWSGKSPSGALVPKPKGFLLEPVTESEWCEIRMAEANRRDLQYLQLCRDTGPLAAYYKLPLNRVLVFHDDMGLPCGVLRLHHEGGHGSHNGLKSVIYHFRGNREFARLRIGIGRPPGQMDPKAFLLQKFNATARERIDAAIQEGVGGLKLLLSKGLTESARRFNTEQKYKHIRLQTMPT